MNQVTKASLLNSYATSDVSTDTSVSPNIHRITGLFPITAGSIISKVQDNSVAEVPQLVTVGLAVTPVVTANSRWQLMIGNTGETREAESKSLTPIGYTATPVLTGNPATDRYNMYDRLTKRINQLSASGAFFATAYHIIQVPYDAQTGNYAVGRVVTGGSSGAQGIILADADAGTTGTLTLAWTTPTVSFVDNETLTDTATGSATTNIPTGATLGVGMAIYDQAGYYRPGRAGQNVVFPTVGFTPAMVNIQTAAVISRGIGTRMLEVYPTLESSTGNLIKGRWEDYTQNLPVAGATYRRITITHRVPVDSGSPLGGAFSNSTKTQVIWLNEADADLAAVTTAILALT